MRDWASLKDVTAELHLQTLSGFISHARQIPGQFLSQNGFLLLSEGITESTDLALEEMEALLSLCRLRTEIFDRRADLRPVTIQPEIFHQPGRFRVIIH